MHLIMSLAYVLIKTEVKKEQEVYDALLKLGEVAELHKLFEEYDLIAKVEARDFGKIGDVVVDKIRTVRGVSDTHTLAAMLF